MIDVWDVRTFDADLHEMLSAKAEVIIGYMKTDLEITLAYDLASGLDRPITRPLNPYASAFQHFREALDLEMRSRTIRAYHYSRMTDEEVGTLRADGVRVSTLSLLRGRLDVLVRAGALAATAADTMFEQSPFHSQPSRSGKFWMASHPISPDDGGVEPLLAHWGGEVASMFLDDESVLSSLAETGTPRILEVAVPMSATTHSYSAAVAVVATFGRAIGGIPEKSAFDLFVTSDLPPAALIRVHSEGELPFANMGRSYPVGYIDVDVGRWKELTGEDD
ncbi:hypothetical protein [Rhizobium leguminosarum]|uniref:Uncharacterized protein n=1 Tax=Rhizobium leguminosarum TaxID=384 RepID=A0A2K9Z6M0_RHILE|nr:hypothetical protein [Rhizobium leguminosarum]AUW43866.1 hypothetical protein CUJ84_Chr003530 [Rhizobium leguminosarum]